MYSINVLVMTYNQQNVIGRLLDSILCQKKYGLNKIIICDDCSTDNNVEVIQKYVVKYPEIVELHVNDRNLGIYGNAHRRVETKGEADLYVHMSGDDALCDGWFRTIQEFINSHHLDVKNDALTIYSDWKKIDSLGKEKIFYNSKVDDKRYPLIDYRLRGLISLRSIIHSKKVLESLQPVDLSHGVPFAESKYENQYVLLSEKNYYCPFIASIYYSEIGFSTKTHTLKYKKDILYSQEQLLVERSWSKRNRNFIKSTIAKSKLEINHSFSSFCKYIYYYLRSDSFKMGCSRLQFVKRVLYVFVNYVLK